MGRHGLALAGFDVGTDRRITECGIVEVNDDSEIVDFQEKPDEPTSTLASIACYGFTADTLSKFNGYLAADNNPDEPGWFIQWLQRPETVHAYPFEEAWFDIGTPESYLDAVAWHLDGENYVHRSADLENVELAGNVQILASADLEDVTVDTSVVFPDATIRGGEIRRSLIDEDTHVEGLNRSGAVISAHTRVNGH